ncbi:sialin [Hydra vulgaris]|uniref:sialin n=1 Tax=Hydra vulgaris TaxID=6087 RepID=UPI000641123A|nr:sialin [Hydra vulgaris]
MADHNKEEKLNGKNLKSNVYQTHRPSKVGLSKSNGKEVSRESPDKDLVNSGKNIQKMNSEERERPTINKPKRDLNLNKSHDNNFYWNNEKNAEFTDGALDTKADTLESYNNSNNKTHLSNDFKLKNTENSVYPEHSVPLQSRIGEKTFYNNAEITSNEPNKEEKNLNNSYGLKDTTHNYPKQSGTEHYSTYPGGTYHHKKRKSSPTETPTAGDERNDKPKPVFNSDVSINNKSASLPSDNTSKQAQNWSENQRKKEISNIDETGEKARLVAVRKLDTPELKRKNETMEGDSESSSTISEGQDSKTDVFLPKRYILAIMMFMGFMNMYAIRVNLNVAIGAMTNNHTISQGGFAVTMPPEFNWSSRLQGVVLGSFYYGYMFLQIPGGWFAMRFGGTKIFGGAIFLASLLTLLTPVATRYSVWALVVLRILEGLVLGVMLPCNHQIWSLWAPLQERSTLVTIAVAGMNVGTVVTMPLTGLLTKYGFDGGWASVFYCFGLFGIAWFLLWLLVVHATPNSHPTITKDERNYINKNVIHRRSMRVPWKAMLTSKPVWAVIIGNVASDWGLYTILICLPLFLMDIMRFNVQTMGFVASLPFLLKAIVGPLGGVVADILRYKCMSTRAVRQLFYAIGAMSAAVMIVIAGYTDSPMFAVLSMCVGVAMSGLLHSGYEVNVLDIAPSLAGIVMGITNTAGTTTGFLSPLLVGFLTEDKLRSQWQLVFWITFLIYLGGTILFCLLCSGEAQHWSLEENDEDENESHDRSKP